jgi:hypothetical protein
VAHLKRDIQEELSGSATVTETISHPVHYGGKENPPETIKCVEAHGLGYTLGNAFKYISRAGKKCVDPMDDLYKAVWYVMHELIVQSNNADEVRTRLHQIVNDL